MDYETARVEDLPASAKGRQGKRDPHSFTSAIRELVDGEAKLVPFAEMGPHQRQNAIHSSAHQIATLVSTRIDKASGGVWMWKREPNG